jgi:hypothetical protein
MQPQIDVIHEQLRQHVQASLRQAENYTAGLGKTYTRLTIGGLASSAVSTLVAGGVALQGSAFGLGASGWQLFCGIAAALGFVSTICMGIVQQLRLGERLPLGQSCVGRLRALNMALTVGSRDWGEIAKEYEAVIKESAEIFG